MFKRNILVILLVGVFALPGTLLAQETEKERMIREIVSVSKAMDQIEGMKEAMTQQLDAQFAASGLTLSENKRQRYMDLVFDMVEELVVEITPMAIQYNGKLAANFNIPFYIKIAS